MNTVPSPAEELVVLDRELAQLDARRSHLLARRAWLLSVLYAPAAPGRPAPPTTPAAAAGAETAPRGARNVLLTLGGVLLAVAAVAFTLVSWGHLGIGGRAAVLAAVTAGALAAPVVLLRRRLGATAETVASLGLLLTVLDAYALHRVALSQTGALAYAAVASAVLAALWAAYGVVAVGLRGPLPVAVVAAQLPLPLWALASGAGTLTVGWALLATAALDVLMAVRLRPGGAVRVVTGATAGATGGGAVLVASWFSVVDGGAGPAVLLLGAAGLALYGAWGATAGGEGWAAAWAVVAGLLAVAGGGGLVREVVPGAWAVPGHLLVAVAVCGVAVRGGVPGAVGRGLAWASAAAQAVALVWALPLVAAAVAGIRPGAPWAVEASLVMVAGVLVCLRSVPARCGALGLGWVAAFGLPDALSLPFGGASAARLLLTAGLLAVVVRPARVAAGLPGRPGAARDAVGGGALGGALLGGVVVAVDAWGTGPAAVVVPGVLCGLLAGAAVLGGGAHRTVAACAAVVAATGLVGAVAAAVDLPMDLVGLALLAVPAATATVGAVLRRHPVAVPVELAGAGAGALAVGTASARPAVLALVLALGGVLAAATAVRPERRPAAGYAATALFVAATWVRLAASGVAAPEAYTVPVTVPALVVGVLRTRRDPAASSWTAYGPGLAATLVPSLFAAWGDADWPRPLLLGLVALAVTLAGARLRLQAPLLLGGAVLALVGVHELAPYVVQAVGALPRWLPPALAGLLLLAVGATYEQRPRDARRLRDTLGRMG
ncbi:SCO7613 C-terminal domain-containing membrane protein [Streptomyces sp. NPDC016309]|uniref:SCO7613 C-terminal domain-containing membrane protein n=1 Tax=Streptomyces sp. NPDC016309 TaxID=3364965 RepID=UPI0036F7E531